MPRKRRLQQKKPQMEQRKLLTRQKKVKRQMPKKIQEETGDDQAAADNVAALIDKIYVQERTDTTDEDCTAAKEAWDALTDAQKELVEGENASPDYFGLDTGGRFSG